jgi:hypothetical protein
VDETFDLGVGRGADGADFVERQGPFEDDAGEPRLAEEPGHCRRTDRNLRRCVQLDGQIHPPQSHVLHDEGIDPGGDQLAGLRLGILQLAVPQQRIERGVDPDAEPMGVVRHACNLSDIVAGGLPSPEPGAADIDGVGPAVDGRDGGKVIFGRSQQLDGFHAGRNF